MEKVEPILDKGIELFWGKFKENINNMSKGGECTQNFIKLFQLLTVFRGILAKITMK